MNLHVETRGAGPPVLLLHGLAGSAATYGWLELEGFTTVRLDFRGHGASDRVPGTYRLSDYVEDALSVLERPSVVVGHSLGGVVGWTIAQRRPELVRAVVMEDPPLYGGGDAAIRNFAALRAAAAAWQAAGASEAAVHAELAAEPPGNEHTPEALDAKASALLRLDLEVLDRVLDNSLLPEVDVELPVVAPVLVLAADEGHGAAFSREHEARIARTHPEVAVVRVPGAGHSIHDTASARELYRAQLVAFVSDAHRRG